MVGYGQVATSDDTEDETQLVVMTKVATADGDLEDNGESSTKGHLVPEEQDNDSECREGSLSFATMAYVVLLDDSTRGIMFPTLWPLVLSLGGTKTTQGFMVAAFSMGRVLVSPVYGWFSSHRGYRDVLVFAHLVTAAGALWYTRVETLGGLLCAQVVLGLGCGTLGVTRSYVAESVPRAQRTIYLGWLTAMQYAGFTTTPSLGSLMNHLGVQLDQIGLPINALSFPAALLFPGAIIACGLLLSRSFIELSPERRAKLQAKHEREMRQQPAQAQRMAIARNNELNGDADATSTETRQDYCAVVGLVLNVITKGSIGCYETILVVYANKALNMGSPTVGFVVAACGFWGVCALLSFKPLSKVFDDVQLMLGGIAVMVVSCLLLIGSIRPPTLSLQIQKKIWALAVFLMYAVGYPIGHTAVIGWFSKAMGKRPQGLLMGLFASAGSVARVAFPIFTGIVAQRLDIDIVFLSLSIMLGVTFLIIFLFASLFRRATA